jgi:hypothetical protein
MDNSLFPLSENKPKKIFYKNENPLPGDRGLY